MENYMVWIWLGIIVLSIIIEALTAELTSVWFTLGGIVSLILSVIPKIPWWAEAIVFVVLSVTFMLTLRKPLTKLLLKGVNTKTNIDAFEGITLSVVGGAENNGYATVKHNGVVWNVVEENGKTLSAGEQVEVLRAEGNKLIVKVKED